MSIGRCHEVDAMNSEIHHFQRIWISKKNIDSLESYAILIMKVLS